MPSLLMLDRADPGVAELMKALRPGVPATLTSVTIEPGPEQGGVMPCAILGMEFDEDDLPAEVTETAEARTDTNEGGFDQGQPKPSAQV
jgi:hypothetical protein